MNFTRNIRTLFLFSILIILVFACSNGESENETFKYDFSRQFKITTRPLGHEKDNLAFVLQLPKEENGETRLSVSTFEVYRNDNLILQRNNFSEIIRYNSWQNSEGIMDSNYQTVFYCLPEGYGESINLNDRIKIVLKCESDRKITNNVKIYLIDNSKAANYWIVLGEQTFDYPATPVPDEVITYNGKNYKLIFNDDFNEDYSDKNPLKNGLYKQAFNMNNWWTEDWGTYSNTSNGYEHRSIKNFKIHDGLAEFPMVREIKYNGNTGVRCNSGPTLITSVWDPKGVNSIPIYEFNKGIFEIKFMGPAGTNHPGQFTFWVLNYKTDFEAPTTNGKIPTNPNKASDGYALDEIDFFEYSPSYNGTGCIRMGTRSSNGTNHRPAAGYSKKVLDSSFGGQWHVFRCIWDDSGLTAYLDGEYMSSVSATSIKGFDNPNDKFMLIVTAQSIKESGIDGNVDSEFEPYSYFVDYIKVYTCMP